jgi:hypothetical protein
VRSLYADLCFAFYFWFLFSWFLPGQGRPVFENNLLISLAAYCAAWPCLPAIHPP